MLCHTEIQRGEIVIVQVIDDQHVNQSYHQEGEGLELYF